MTLRHIALTVVVAAIAATACCSKKECCPKKDMCVQMYSARDIIGDPAKGKMPYDEVLKTISEMGYTAIEAANYNDGKLYGDEPEVFKQKVEAAGMKVLSSHIGRGLSPEELESGDFTAAMEWWDKAIAAHKAAGMKYMVTPGIGGQKSLKDLQTYCDYLNAVGKKCAEAGIGYGYHNHSYEFEKVEGKVMYDYMIENTDPKYVFFQMDVYWAVIGNASPVEYFQRYPGRFRMLHIKDEKEIGQSGMVGFDAIFKNAELAGLEDFVVEIERYSYDDILKSFSESAEYLLSAPFVKPSYSCCKEK